jgi:D-alanyl-D-alanine dipeptidase
MQASIKKLHPYFSEAQLRAETCKYVAPATDNEDTQLPNHNTGGAIDLTLFDLVTGEPWDFGTEFDHTSELAHSDFFEGPVEPAYGIDEVRWLLIRRNRRVLFHLMKQLGFVNYHYEWWHYDLGDCHWANIHGLDWHYASMENDFILKKLTAYT